MNPTITAQHIESNESDTDSPLMFVPVPLATGTIVLDPDSRVARRVDSIEVVVRFSDGTAQTRPLVREHTGWWLTG